MIINKYSTDPSLKAVITRAAMAIAKVAHLPPRAPSITDFRELRIARELLRCVDSDLQAVMVPCINAAQRMNSINLTSAPTVDVVNALAESAKALMRLVAKGEMIRAENNTAARYLSGTTPLVGDPIRPPKPTPKPTPKIETGDELKAVLEANSMKASSGSVFISPSQLTPLSVSQGGIFHCFMATAEEAAELAKVMPKSAVCTVVHRETMFFGYKALDVLALANWMYESFDFRHILVHPAHPCTPFIRRRSSQGGMVDLNDTQSAELLGLLRRYGLRKPTERDYLGCNDLWYPELFFVYQPQDVLREVTRRNPDRDYRFINHQLVSRYLPNPKGGWGKSNYNSLEDLEAIDGSEGPDDSNKHSNLRPRGHKWYQPLTDYGIKVRVP